ncbi:MAG: alcohol dehydrogenase catalytic domain-containing protein [Thermoanaerobaculales bacterium]|nr:alcohol dehydrogenase catalytic domain-containing protein [Thermoanaerobaculales bacterium]
MADTQRIMYLIGPEQVEMREEVIPRPGPGEIVLRVKIATTCGTDLKVYLRGGHPCMLNVPCPFGHEMAGTVWAVGKNVKGFREGDALVVANSASCGECELCRAGRENLCLDLQYLNGAYAEYLLIPPRFVRRSSHRRATDLEPALAAMAEPLACVFHGLSACDLKTNSEVVVLGAGPIGLMFVAELAHRGHRVILADVVPDRLDVGSRLGATVTVPLSGTVDDGGRLREATSEGRGAELVIEATGVPIAWTNSMKAVGLGGQVVLFGGCAPGTQIPCDTHRLHYSEITVKGVYHHRPATFRAALDRLADRSLKLELLLQAEYGLEGVERALQRMAVREILKASIKP